MATSIIAGLTADKKPSLQNFRNFAYFTDGFNMPYYFNEYEGDEWYHRTPVEVPTETHAGAGAMTAVAGGFIYAITEANFNSSDGIHQCHQTNLSGQSVITGNFAAKDVIVTVAAAALNTMATHKMIYGTEDGGSIFYYLGAVAVGTTTFTDNNITRDSNLALGKLTTNSDGTVTQTLLNYPMRMHKFLTASKSRIFASGAGILDTGTVTVVNGDATVAGAATAWPKSIVGAYFQKDGDSRKYLIASWTSATSIELSETYGGTGTAGSDYTIREDSNIVRYSTKHPITGISLPWSFPADHYSRILRSDDSEIRGMGILGESPVVFKEYSHYLLTEYNDDMIIEESQTKVGTKSHWSIARTSDNGNLIFCTPEGLIYETNGNSATYLGIDLKDTDDGINRTRVDTVHGVWVDTKQWYMLAYSAEGSTRHDRVLVYDYELKQWGIWAIDINCMAMIIEEVGGQDERRPWFGSVGGFVYKMLADDCNFGSGTAGTLSGTATGFGAATLTDTTAAFYTTGDGQTDVYVQLYDTDGVFQEQQKVASNNATIITVDTNWTSTPVAGWTYTVGGIICFWKSKVFDFGLQSSKTIIDALINFTKTAVSRNVYVRCYYSEDPEMPAASTYTLTFDLSNNYYTPLNLPVNRQRYFQYELYWYGVNAPVAINSIEFNVMEYPTN